MQLRSNGYLLPGGRRSSVATGNGAGQRGQRNAEVEEDEDEKPAVVDGPLEIDGLEQKSLKELRDMLTKKGIPFGKRDTKGVLISLLKATA